MLSKEGLVIIAILDHMNGRVSVRKLPNTHQAQGFKLGVEWHGPGHAAFVWPFEVKRDPDDPFSYGAIVAAVRPHVDRDELEAYLRKN